MLCVQLSATTHKRIATEHQETSTFFSVIYVQSSANVANAPLNTPSAIWCGIIFKIYVAMLLSFEMLSQSFRVRLVHGL